MGRVAPARQRPASHYLPGLDGLRAAAISVVMLSHFFPYTFAGGFLGVDVFFVVSGYIITARLLIDHQRSARIDLRRFYRRRIRRLWPALWVLVGTVTLLGIALGGRWKAGLTPRAQILDAVYALTSTMNVVRAWALAGGGQTYLGHSWSLAAEEQFYLVWPPLLGLALRARLRARLPIILLAAIAVVALWRAWVGQDSATVAVVQRVYFGPDTRVDTLLGGCLLALVGTRAVPPVLIRLWVVPAAVLAALVVGLRLTSPWLPRGGYSVILLCAVWLVAASVENVGLLQRLLASSPMRWAGLRSYSLYLWHTSVLALVEMAPIRSRYAVPISVPLILLTAELSYRFVERRFSRLRPG